MNILHKIILKKHTSPLELRSIVAIRSPTTQAWVFMTIDPALGSWIWLLAVDDQTVNPLPGPNLIERWNLYTVETFSPAVVRTNSNPLKAVS